MKRARAESAAWTAGLVASATVVLVGAMTFMTRVHRDAAGMMRAQRDASWAPPARSGRPRSTLPPAEGVPESATPATPTVPVVPAASSGAAPATPVTGVTPDTAIDGLRARHLTIPVAGSDAQSLAQSFSQARGGRVHEALDIMAPAGTPVVAVEDGTVAKLFTSQAGGLTIYQFDPSQSVAYYYAHLQGYASGVVDGATVRRGQVIGYVGSTGNANPAAPHLHFAIFVLGAEKRWWEGTAIDPYSVFR